MQVAEYEEVAGLYIFGSRSRGDSDSASDTDVLVVYRQEPSSSERNWVKQQIAASLRQQCEFAEYSAARLARLFEQGHLFAWHLHQEAQAFNIPSMRLTDQSSFPRPAPYKGSLTDVHNFTELLRSSSVELTAERGSVIYEAGVLYLAMRNIAMSLSFLVMDRVDFTRWSPFHVSDALGVEAPVDLSLYTQLIAARHASQRGLESPKLDASRVLSAIKETITWARNTVEVANADAVE